jgi:fibronectin type 3 domain-containing protein
MPLAILLALSSLVLFAQNGYCSRVTLAWDPNPPEDNVIGYKVYYGIESNAYTTVLDVANVTLVKIRHLEKGKLYYFAVTAYDVEGQESDFSQELVVNTCTYLLSRATKSFGAAGGIGKVKVTTQSECHWTAASGTSWLTIMEGDSGTGSGTIAYSVETNPAPEKRRVGSTFAGKAFTVKQKGAVNR